MTRVFTCIVCPNGCEITTETENGAAAAVSGNLCPRGESYVRQELTDPRRTISSSAAVKGGELPLVSVRLTEPIPKAMIFDAMAEIRKLSLTAPVAAGTVLIKGILGTDSDVIATKDIAAV